MWNYYFWFRVYGCTGRGLGLVPGRNRTVTSGAHGGWFIGMKVSGVFFLRKNGL